MPARRAIFVAPFDELAEPGRVLDLAVRAEERGWDGFFVWDHVAYAPPVRALADPWVTLAAIAARTEKLIIGPMVTPWPGAARTSSPARPSRSTGSAAAGSCSGSGSAVTGAVSSPRSASARRAIPRPAPGCSTTGSPGSGVLGRRLRARPDPAADIPIWVASRWPSRRPLRRAARYHGLFPIDLPDPDALAALVAEVTGLRADGPEEGQPFDIAITEPAGTDLEPWVAAGATWCLTGFSSQPTVDQVRTAIDQA